MTGLQGYFASVSRNRPRPDMSFAADQLTQVIQCRQEAHKFRFDYGYDMPCHVLAARMADLAQVCGFVLFIYLFPVLSCPYHC